MATLDPSADRWLRRLGERVLADAKSIRCQYLQGFGSHSYGRLAARRVEGDRVALVGTGALAQKVLDQIAIGLAVDVWGRRRDATAGLRGRAVRQLLIADAESIATADAGATSMVVAAPIDEPDLNTIVCRYPGLVRVIDLRAADQQTPIDSRIPLVTLAQLLAESSSTAATASVPAAAAAEVRRRARAFASREELRPFGWDDLCA
jgi:hypothetical protein